MKAIAISFMVYRFDDSEQNKNVRQGYCCMHLTKCRDSTHTNLFNVEPSDLTVSSNTANSNILQGCLPANTWLLKH